MLTFILKCFFVLFTLTSCQVVSDYVYKTRYLTVPLDHYSFHTDQSFKLKYLVNDTFWDSTKGPIFFYAGNEGSIEAFAVATGFMWELAQELQAKVIFGEHRYYGESLPFGNKSEQPQNLVYLTTTQALADFAHLIDHERTERNPVIAFGGSYGGMLAAYLRMKYPHLVDGAIASSAPVNMFPGMTPCSRYYEIVTESYMKTSPTCGNNIRRSWSILRNFTRALDPNRLQYLYKQWKLCQPVESSDDVDVLLTYLKGVYETLATVNYPYETGALRKTPAHVVYRVCDILNDHSTTTDEVLVQGIGKVLNLFINYPNGSSCVGYKDGIPGGTYAQGAWGYQRCTEIVLPTCTTGETDIFEPEPWNITHLSNVCKQRYNGKTDPDRMRIEFGGKKLHAASNIVFSNGDLDPWSAGGISSDINDSIKVVNISDAAHHLDLMSTNPADLESVTRARKTHKENVKSWIKQFESSSTERLYENQ